MVIKSKSHREFKKKIEMKKIVLYNSDDLWCPEHFGGSTREKVVEELCKIYEVNSEYELDGEILDNALYEKMNEIIGDIDDRVNFSPFVFGLRQTKYGVNYELFHPTEAENKLFNGENEWNLWSLSQTLAKDKESPFPQIGDYDEIGVNENGDFYVEFCGRCYELKNLTEKGIKTFENNNDLAELNNAEFTTQIRVKGIEYDDKHTQKSMRKL